MARLGVGHAFGVVGSGNFVLTNALRDAGVPFVAARHEMGATTMADAYARTTGRPAVVTLHQGCGLTNATTGIAEAAKSRTPLLVVAADVAATALRSNFRIGQDELATSVGAVAERVHGAASAATDVGRAWRTAVYDRRTVVLGVPLDVQAQLMDADAWSELATGERPAPVAPAAHDVEQLVELLRRAERPVFIAGRGARDQAGPLRELAGRTGALLATSAVAKGLFEGDPYDLGISGGFATPLAAELISAADLVLAWGCSLTMWTTRHGKLLAPGTTVIQVDDDATALGANRPVTLGVHADVAETLRAVNERIDATAGDQVPDRASYRSAGVADRIAGQGRWGQVATVDLSDGRTIDPRVLSRELDERLPRDRVVAVDSGNFMGYPAAYLSVPDPAGFCFTQSFQSIGLGLATAIGAGLASPGRLPVLATGDGGLLMAIAELETAVRLRLGLLIVVYDDHAYGAEIHHFGRAADLATVTFPDADLAALARGFGADGIVVRRVDDLAALQPWLDGPRDRPLLIDAKISDDGGSWWLAEAFRGH